MFLDLLCMYIAALFFLSIFKQNEQGEKKIEEMRTGTTKIFIDILQIMWFPFAILHDQ